MLVDETVLEKEATVLFILCDSKEAQMNIPTSVKAAWGQTFVLELTRAATEKPGELVGQRNMGRVSQCCPETRGTDVFRT